MRIGVVFPQTELDGDPDAARRFGLAAEELGYDHLLAYDHVVGATHDREPKLTGPYTERDPFHDPFVLFAYLAGMTRRLEFATGVLILPQRQTVLVAKQAADLDLLSGGRLRIGVGIGWNYVEYDALGQDFRSRVRRLEEQIPLLRRLWGEDLVSFSGAFDRIDRAGILPRPRRMIPLWMGGSTEAAYRRAAKIADGFIFSRDGAEAWEGLALYERFLAEQGRDGAGKELLLRFAASPADIAATAEQWRARGGTHVSVCTMGRGLRGVTAHIDFVAEAMRKLRQ